MYWEFRGLIKDALHSSAFIDFLRVTGVEGGGVASLVRGLRPQFSVPPAGIGADISTNIAFLVSKRLQDSPRRSLLQLNPDAVAESLLEIANGLQGEQQLFAMELGGPGFINARFSEHLKESFLATLFVQGGQALYGSESLVYQTSVDQEEEPLSLVGLRVNWGKLKGLDERDMRLLLGEERGVTSLAFEKKLMLLGLAADPELDVYAYLRSLNSRENLPWYTKRFRRDSRQFLKLLACRLKGQGISEGTRLPFVHTSATQGARDSLCGFRLALCLAAEHYRADKFFALLLEEIRSFYSYYNRPEIRALPTKGSIEECCSVYQITRIIGQLVDYGLELLFEECLEFLFEECLEFLFEE